MNQYNNSVYNTAHVENNMPQVENNLPLPENYLMNQCYQQPYQIYDGMNRNPMHLRYDNSRPPSYHMLNIYPESNQQIPNQPYYLNQSVNNYSNGNQYSMKPEPLMPMSYNEQNNGNALKDKQNINELQLLPDGVDALKNMGPNTNEICNNINTDDLIMMTHSFEKYVTITGNDNRTHK